MITPDYRVYLQNTPCMTYAQVFDLFEQKKVAPKDKYQLGIYYFNPSDTQRIEDLERFVQNVPNKLLEPGI